VEGNDPHEGHGRVCEGDRARIGVSHRMVEVKLLCFRWLSSFIKLVFFKPIHPPYLPAYEDKTECSETSTYKIQTPGNYPEESTQVHIMFNP